MALEATAKKIPQQRWWRIIPPAMLVYIFSYMDRTNLGFAIAGGMDKDIGLTATAAGMAAGIFFFGYLLLQIPGGHLAERASAKKFIAGTIVFWGGLSILTGLVQNEWQLMVVRFFLGVAEGGVWPAMLAIISHWFPKEERARANAFFIMNAAIAQIISGPLNGWMISEWGWRGLFFREGILSIALIFVWWPLISDRPDQAKWISKEERDYINQKIAEEQQSIKAAGDTPVSYKQILVNPNVWKLTTIYLCYNVGIYGYVMWLPTILKSLTNSGMTAIGFLSAVPYIATIIGQYLVASRADHTGNRRLYTGLPALGFAIALILSVLTKDMIGLSFAFLVVCGFFLQSFSGVFWSIPPMLFPSEVAGGARGIINAIGNLGGFMGPFMVGWIITNMGSMNTGIYVLAGFLLTGFLVSFTLPSITAGIEETNKTAAGVSNGKDA